MRTLPPGAYTVILRGDKGGTGIGLVEAYDLGQTTDSKMANISTRGFVQTRDNVMIGGLILGGGIGVSKVVVRAIGPSLAQSGITNPLADPTLELRDGNGALLRSNDDWKKTQQAAIQATGLALAEVYNLQ